MSDQETDCSKSLNLIGKDVILLKFLNRAIYFREFYQIANRCSYFETKKTFELVDQENNFIYPPLLSAESVKFLNFKFHDIPSTNLSFRDVHFRPSSESLIPIDLKTIEHLDDTKFEELENIVLFSDIDKLFPSLRIPEIQYSTFPVSRRENFFPFSSKARDSLNTEENLHEFLLEHLIPKDFIEWPTFTIHITEKSIPLTCKSSIKSTNSKKKNSLSFPSLKFKIIASFPCLFFGGDTLKYKPYSTSTQSARVLKQKLESIHYDTKEEDSPVLPVNDGSSIIDSIDTFILLKGKKIQNNHENKPKEVLETVKNEPVLLLGFTPSASHLIDAPLQKVIVNRIHDKMGGKVSSSWKTIAKLDLILRDFMPELDLVILSPSHTIVIIETSTDAKTLESYLNHLYQTCCNVYFLLCLHRGESLHAIISNFRFLFHSLYNIYYSYNEVHTQIIVRRLLDNLSLNSDRIWLTKEESIHEKFLCSLTMFNPMSAQYALSHFSLDTLCLEDPNQVIEYFSTTAEKISETTLRRFYEIIS